MGKYSYTIEVQDESGTWFKTFGEVGLEYGRGYLRHSQESPGPRLALRLVRSDGRVMCETNALSEASIGMVAGWPTAEQYRRAAERCLRAAERIEGAVSNLSGKSEK